MSAPDDDDWKSRGTKRRKTKILLGALAGAAAVAVVATGGAALGLFAIPGVIGTAGFAVPAAVAGGAVAGGGLIGGTAVGMSTRHPDPEHRWNPRKSKLLRLGTFLAAGALGVALTVGTGGVALALPAAVGLPAATATMGAAALTTAGTATITGAAAVGGVGAGWAGLRRFKRGPWDALPKHAAAPSH